MSELKIKSVEKGYGNNSILFSTDPLLTSGQKVDEIIEEIKEGAFNFRFNVYRGYIKNNLVFEMGASIDVTVVVWISNK